MEPEHLSFLQVTDMMLQDQNYPDWAGAARRFWKRGNNRIVLFWYIRIHPHSMTCVFRGLRTPVGRARGHICFGAISAFYYRQSISASILLQSVSAPFIRGNQWGRSQGERGLAAHALTLRYLLNKCSEPQLQASYSGLQVRDVNLPVDPLQRSEKEGRV